MKSNFAVAARLSKGKRITMKSFLLLTRGSNAARNVGSKRFRFLKTQEAKEQDISILITSSKNR